jgi:hypothetical protein
VLAHEAAALADIKGTFAEPILYTGETFADEPLTAVPSNVAAQAFQGVGATLREISFEIDQGDLPFDPDKGHIIVHAAARWRVNDITRRDDIGAWVLIVEEDVA